MSTLASNEIEISAKMNGQNLGTLFEEVSIETLLRFIELTTVGKRRRRTMHSGGTSGMSDCARGGWQGLGRMVSKTVKPMTGYNFESLNIRHLQDADVRTHSICSTS